MSIQMFFELGIEKVEKDLNITITVCNLTQVVQRKHVHIIWCIIN